MIDVKPQDRLFFGHTIYSVMSCSITCSLDYEQDESDIFDDGFVFRTKNIEYY